MKLSIEIDPDSPADVERAERLLRAVRGDSMAGLPSVPNPPSLAPPKAKPRRAQRIVPPEPEELGKVTDLDTHRVANAVIRKGGIAS